jgi:hypothetical protein
VSYAELGVTEKPSAVRIASRRIGGALFGIVASAVIGGWLLAALTWVGTLKELVALGSASASDWVSMLVSWTISEYLGQSIGAFIAGWKQVVWPIAVATAIPFALAFNVDPHWGWIVAAALPFSIACFVTRTVPL